MMDASNDIIEQLAPTGELRAGINLGNFLLVSGKNARGEPTGVAPDMARNLAEKLGVPVRYVTYDQASTLADSVGSGDWDVGLLGAEPQRAEQIAFTRAYVEIEATYLVAGTSDLQKPEDVDQPGRKITVSGRAAYGLWLERNIVHAQLLQMKDHESALQLFTERKLDALAGLRPRLIKDVELIAESRLLDGRFTAVQQAIGVPIDKAEALGFLSSFVAASLASGLVTDLIAKHGIMGLSAAK